MRPVVRVLDSENRIPWSGHSGRYAWGEVYEAIRPAKMTLVFVNTRSQAEMTFQALWRMNEEHLPIALHHGSLDVERRRKVEAAMARGDLRAVVCTSTLDLGIDWGDVDLVIQMGAPKGASRLTQRIGRANHRMDEPSSALLAPANRFEVLEGLAAQAAVTEGALDGDPPREGALDVLVQHIMGMACAAPFDPDELYTEVISAAPYAHLDRVTFDRALAFVATGGYALKGYDRFRRIVKTPEGRYRAKSPETAQQYRLNVGTIVEAASFGGLLGARGRAGPGRKLGTAEEWLIQGLAPGDTFLFAGEILRFEGVEGTDAFVTRAAGEIAGHLHPCAKVVAEGRRIRRPCFAADGARLVMPAFGAYAGGLNVLDAAFAPFFDDLTAWVMGRDGVYSVTAPMLAPDPREAAPLGRRVG